MRDESPLTGLPGNVRIQEEIEGRVERGEEFALLYVDIDNFKPYNDHYGFARGDEVIQGVGQLVEDVGREFTDDASFVGHLGGDDFAMVVPPESAALIAETIVQRFDKSMPSHYDDEDRDRGWIEVLNRRGEPQRYMPITLSIGIATTQRRRFAHFAEAVAVATEMKNYTKAIPGSSWALDRRSG
jgi:diguanylate cyclase (GGDEF)-like protein